MARTVFFGFGSYVGTIGGKSVCAFWADDPANLNWASAALVPIDLSKNPTAARKGGIPVSAIEVDDDITAGGLNEIGPYFPLGRAVGACWLSETYWNSLKNKPPRQPGDQFYDYELTSVQYWDGELQDRRFYGLHAKILDHQGTLSRVKIWQPGFSKPPALQVASVAWLDLAQVADPNFTKIHKQGDEGALFLDRETAQAAVVRRPKLPPSFGLSSIDVP